YQFGCEEVLINDSHSKMNNILIDQLHPDATLITGEVKPFSMMQGLDNSYMGAMFIGYHARAGQFGVMPHAMIHAVRSLYINDHVIGELRLNAYVASHYGLAVVRVGGAEQAGKEAEELMSNITTTAVKETISRSSVKSMTPKQAGGLLPERVTTALSHRHQV